jgi:hypothetical protein|tara:strand:+ start:3507 stop:4130 length:624 start_codon:yes stop_codon:yes gene_type:complete
MEFINNLQVSQEDLSSDKVRLLENSFNKSIPGQSLTNSVDQPYAWEQAPVYTSVPEAATAIFTDMVEEDNYIPLLRALKSGTPVLDIATSILYRGFQLGQFNPDLMLLLLEPVMYMIMALAEKAGIGDIQLYEGEEDEEEFDTEEKKENIENIKKTLRGRANRISEQSVADIPELQQQLGNFEPNEQALGLLDRPNQDTQENLLDRR